MEITLLVTTNRRDVDQEADLGLELLAGHKSLGIPTNKLTRYGHGGSPRSQSIVLFTDCSLLPARKLRSTVSAWKSGGRERHGTG